MPGRLTAIVISLVLVVAACGDDSPATGPGPVATEAPTALEAAEAAVASLGDDLTAALAILLALDRGYTPGQIVEAVMAGALLATGVVANGVEPVQPDGIPTDVIVDKGPLELAAAQGTMILAMGPTGAAVTVSEAKGYLDAFDGWVTEQIAPAQPEPPHVDPDELERLIRYIVTFNMLRFADAGWSAEQIIEALIFQDFVCVPYEGCSMPEGTPANSALGGVLASAESGTTTTRAPSAGDGFVLEDGIYVGEIDLGPSHPTLVAVNDNRVIMEVRDGHYTIFVSLDYVWEPCPSTSRETFNGVGEFRRTHISFRGVVEGSTVAGGICEPNPYSYREDDFAHATIWVTEDRFLECTCPGGFAQLVREE